MSRSPSPRRAWIEIPSSYAAAAAAQASPSPRRAWIEMSDRMRRQQNPERRPPHGGRHCHYMCSLICFFCFFVKNERIFQTIVHFPKLCVFPLQLPVSGCEVLLSVFYIKILGLCRFSLHDIAARFLAHPASFRSDFHTFFSVWDAYVYPILEIRNNLWYTIKRRESAGVFQIRFR